MEVITTTKCECKSFLARACNAKRTGVANEILAIAHMSEPSVLVGLTKELEF